MSYKNTVYERLCSNIKFIKTKKSHSHMAVTTVSMQYSKVTFNRILQSKQQLRIREERNWRKRRWRNFDD